MRKALACRHDDRQPGASRLRAARRRRLARALSEEEIVFVAGRGEMSELHRLEQTAAGCRMTHVLPRRRSANWRHRFSIWRSTCGASDRRPKRSCARHPACWSSSFCAPRERVVNEPSWCSSASDDAHALDGPGRRRPARSPQGHPRRRQACAPDPAPHGELCCSRSVRRPGAGRRRRIRA